MASQCGLEDTVVALRGLQQCLEPWISILQHEGVEQEARPSPHSVAMAQTLVALTLATLCFLKPRVVRTSKLATTPTLLASSNSQLQIQIRSDLNHLRQLLSSLESGVTTKPSVVSISLSERHTATAMNEATVTSLGPDNFTKRKAKELPSKTPKTSCKKRKVNK
jgi:hypothetical protein